MPLLPGAGDRISPLLSLNNALVTRICRAAGRILNLLRWQLMKMAVEGARQQLNIQIVDQTQLSDQLQLFFVLLRFCPLSLSRNGENGIGKLSWPTIGPQKVESIAMYYLPIHFHPVSIIHDI